MYILPPFGEVTSHIAGAYSPSEAGSLSLELSAALSASELGCKVTCGTVCSVCEAALLSLSELSEFPQAASASARTAAVQAAAIFLKLYVIKMSFLSSAISYQSASACFFFLPKMRVSEAVNILSLVNIFSAIAMQTIRKIIW